MATTQHGPLVSHPQFSPRINGLLPWKNGGRLRLMRLFIPKDFRQELPQADKCTRLIAHVAT